jgi:hypothetical protein
MSAQQPQGPPPGAGEPTDEEIRAAYEAQLSQISATDMIAQSVVSLLNIGAFRISGPAEGQPPAPDDLAQARDAIDGAMALMAILERSIPREVQPLRAALSQLQLAYSREAQGAAPAASAGTDEGAPAPPPPSGDPAGAGAADGPGPAQSSGRLWVPGS